MSKYPNPIRGYLHCPVCASASSVHQVGEGQLIATGEPPKNSRNIGLMYYRCPECGNSAISHTGTNYIKAHMVEQKSDLGDEVRAVEAVITTEPLTDDSTLCSVTEIATQANGDVACSGGDNVTKVVGVDVKKWVKQGVIMLGLLLFLAWSIKQLMPKPQVVESTQGGEHV